MSVKNLFVLMLCAMPASVTCEELPYQAAAGLWQLAWSNGSSGYMCVDLRFQPWRLKESPGLELGDCLVKDVEWRDPSGNKLRIRSSKSERQWQEGKTYRVETICLTDSFNYSRSQSPVSRSTTEAKAVWVGDLRGALDFSESATRALDGVRVDEARVSYQLKWLGECPAVLPAGGKCRIPTADSPANSEWPACDPDLIGKSSR